MIPYPIRRLKPNELEQALEMVYETFIQFEAPDYDPEGVITFRRDIIENASFKKACQTGENRIWGAFDAGRIIGVIALRGEKHITLLFTKRGYQRLGVATALLHTLVEDVKTASPHVKWLTVNSSPYGAAFYHQAGFVDTGLEKTLNGIRFTPMMFTL